MAFFSVSRAAVGTAARQNGKRRDKMNNATRRRARTVFARAKLIKKKEYEKPTIEVVKECTKSNSGSTE